jgi:hypothetical protein
LAAFSHVHFLLWLAVDERTLEPHAKEFSALLNPAQGILLLQNLVMANQAEEGAFLALEKALKEGPRAVDSSSATCSRNLASDGSTTTIRIERAKLAGKRDKCLLIYLYILSDLILILLYAESS